MRMCSHHISCVKIFASEPSLWHSSYHSIFRWVHSDWGYTFTSPHLDESWINPTLWFFFLYVLSIYCCWNKNKAKPKIHGNVSHHEIHFLMTVTFWKLLVNTFVSVGWLLLSLVTLRSFQFSLMPPTNYCFFLLRKQLCLLFHCKIWSMTVPCPPSIAIPLPSIRGLRCSSLLNAKWFTCVLVQNFVTVFTAASLWWCANMMGFLFLQTLFLLFPLPFTRYW